MSIPRWLRAVRRVIFWGVSVVVLLVAVALIAIHTDAGRELVRGQIVKALNGTFVGGATIGKLEGSPFGQVVLRDVVIRGPDHEPAITIGTMRLELALIPLVKKEVKLERIVVEDLEVHAVRGTTGVNLARLLIPKPALTWNVELQSIDVVRGHVAIDTGGEPVNFDGLVVQAAANLPYGGSINASARITGRWRERGVDGDVALTLRTDGQFVEVPVLLGHIDHASVLATGVRIDGLDAPVPSIGGWIAIDASAQAITRFAPSLQLPDDVLLGLAAQPHGRSTAFTLAARAGASQLRAAFAAELDTRHAAGVIETLGEVDLGRWTQQRIAGAGGGLVVFDVAPAGAHAVITATGAVPDLPVTRATIVVGATLDRGGVLVEATGPAVRASLTAEGRHAGAAWLLDRGRLVATTDDPARFAHEPVSGTAHVDLAVHGELAPELELAVTGTIDGTHVRYQDISVHALHVAIDATGLPGAPRGHAKLDAFEVARGTLQLGTLALDATNRADGRILVAVSARQAAAPSLVELDALVTPPHDGTVVVELLRHRVYASPTSDWTGASGHIELGPARITLRDLHSASRAGSVVLAGSLERTGRRAGELTAVLDASVALDQLLVAARGSVIAHVEVQRAAGQSGQSGRSGQWSGSAKLGATGITLDPSMPAITGTATIAGRPHSVVVEADATTSLGAATVSLAIDAPANLTDLAAWRRLDRSALQRSQLSLKRVDLAQLARLAGATATRGQLDGDFEITATTATGTLHVRQLALPQLRDVGELDADLELSQPALGQLALALTTKLGGIGQVDGKAELDLPAHPFDARAWRLSLVREASLRVAQIAVDPAMLARFGITAPLRAEVGASLELDHGTREAKLAVEVLHLRGSPIAQPIDLRLAATLDAAALKLSLAMQSKDITLFDLRASTPITLAKLIDDPRAALATPLQGTLTMPNTPAPRLMAIFGRSEMTDGTIEGTLTLGGTLRAPTGHASFVATELAVAPRLRSKPLQKVKRLSLDATWDGHAGTLAVDGSEDAGGTLHLVASGTSWKDATATLEAVKFELTPLLAMAPGPAGGAAGKLDGKLALTGLDPATATVAGELHLTGARIPSGVQIGTLRDASFDIVVSERVVELKAAGKLGQGTIKLDGTAAIQGGALATAQAKITLRKVSPIGAVQPVIDADVTAKLARGTASTWAVELVIDHANIVVPKDGGEELKPVGAPSDMVFANGKPVTRTSRLAMAPPANPTLIATIVLHAATVKTEELRGIVSGKVVVSLDGRTIGATGTIAADRGDLDLFARRYALERAAVIFDGSIDPMLDVRISHDFPEVTTVTEVRGRLSKPQLVMSSEPGTYSQGQLLGFLLGGEPSTDPNTASGRDQVTSAGTSVITGALGGYVKKALPIDLDVLRYETASASTSAAITVGRWLTGSLFLAYRQHLAPLPDENNGEGEVEYWLSRRVIVEGVAGDRGVNTVDLVWRKRY